MVGISAPSQAQHTQKWHEGRRWEDTRGEEEIEYKISIPFFTCHCCRVCDCCALSSFVWRRQRSSKLFFSAAAADDKRKKTTQTANIRTAHITTFTMEAEFTRLALVIEADAAKREAIGKEVKSERTTRTRYQTRESPTANYTPYQIYLTILVPHVSFACRFVVCCSGR